MGSGGQGKVCFYGQGSDSCQSARQSLLQNTPYVRCSIINHFNKQTGVTICLLGAKPMLRTGGAKMNKRWGSGPGLGWGKWDTCLRSKI